MRVWIDITNSPHVLFFRPLIERLIADGHEVEVTARDYAQTIGLLERERIPYHLFGRHRGGRVAAKAWGLVSRSLSLVRFGFGKRFDVAFSHNSNDLAVAARLLGIPHLIVHDYEHANLMYAINARLADRILVPEAIPAASIEAHGARPGKVGHFPGLKEHVYLDAGRPWHDVRGDVGLPADCVLVIARPPATMSAYHHGFGNDLFGRILDDIGRRPEVGAIVLPRTPEQAADLAPGLPSNAVIPDEVLDGSSLVRSADLVISAGGTMNREAAVFGTPAYTVFAGVQGAVDDDLIARGLLTRISDPGEIRYEHHASREGWWVENRETIVEELYALARR